MSNPSADTRGNVWPSPGVLLLCAVLLAAGYAVAVVRGPAPAQEVRMVEMPAPAPEPEAALPDE
jgi:hypothetical protein